jgi:hypothetical protein
MGVGTVLQHRADRLVHQAAIAFILAHSDFIGAWATATKRGKISPLE